jgi:hypothetical protein
MGDFGNPGPDEALAPVAASRTQIGFFRSLSEACGEYLSPLQCDTERIK